MTQNQKVLIINCMKDDRLAASFDRAIMRPIQKKGKTAEFCRITPTPSNEPPDLHNYSHVIISGSEASVTDDNPWDEFLTRLINTALTLNKPLLGICYGHQFICRTILGKKHTRKSPTPEFGWERIHFNFKNNPIFAGIDNLESMVSHYDEVFYIPHTGNMKVLASTPRCAVHAVQYDNLPVWGVQFHPEYNKEEADEIFDLLRIHDPLLASYFFHKTGSQIHCDRNEKILVNFLSAS